mgnify:CR=1 FL=1
MAKKKKQTIVEQVVELLPKLSAITEAQARKIAKAAAYSFVSSVVGLSLLQLQAGVVFDKTFWISAFIASVNTALVTVKQAFTESK